MFLLRSRAQAHKQRSQDLLRIQKINEKSTFRVWQYGTGRFIIFEQKLLEVYHVISKVTYIRFMLGSLKGSSNFHGMSVHTQTCIYNGPNLLLYQMSSRGFCSRRLVEIFYQMSSSRKIATYQTSFRRSKYLLEVQQQKNSSTRCLVEFLFGCLVELLLDVQQTR